MYKTFNEWSSAGYKIKKGSKATWINNTPQFSENDVVYSRRVNKGYHWIGTDSSSRGALDYDDEFDNQDNPLQYNWLGFKY